MKRVMQQLGLGIFVAFRKIAGFLVQQANLVIRFPLRSGSFKNSPVVGSKLKRHDLPHEDNEKKSRKINVSVRRIVCHSLANQ
jgi:hypothetical protein